MRQLSRCLGERAAEGGRRMGSMGERSSRREGNSEVPEIKIGVRVRLHLKGLRGYLGQGCGEWVARGAEDLDSELRF